MLAIDHTARVSLSKAPSPCQLQWPVSVSTAGALRRGTALTRMYPRESILDHGVIKKERSVRTYLWTEVLNWRSWGPGPLRWLSVQTWPSVLCYLISSWEINQLQTKRSAISGVARSADQIHIHTHIYFCGLQSVSFVQKMVTFTVRRQERFIPEGCLGGL